MKRIAIVILGIFFIALAADAFAGDFVGDLKSSLGNIQKATYETVMVRPCQAGAFVGQALSPHINNAYNAGLSLGFSNTLTRTIVANPRPGPGTDYPFPVFPPVLPPRDTAKDIYNAVDFVSKTTTGVGIDQHINTAYKFGSGIGNTIGVGIDQHVNTAYKLGAGIGNTIIDAWNNQPKVSSLALINPAMKKEFSRAIIGTLNEATYSLYKVNPDAGRLVFGILFPQGHERPEQIGCLMQMEKSVQIKIIKETRAPVYPTGNVLQTANKSAVLPNLTMPNGNKVNTDFL